MLITGCLSVLSHARQLYPFYTRSGHRERDVQFHSNDSLMHIFTHAASGAGALEDFKECEACGSSDVCFARQIAGGQRDGMPTTRDMTWTHPVSPVHVSEVTLQADAAVQCGE